MIKLKTTEYFEELILDYIVLMIDLIFEDFALDCT